MKRTDKTPPYSPESGLPPEFFQKYGLSNREAEVAVVLLQGKSDREVAAHLDITVSTVKSHLRKIYRKVGVKGRFALMAMVTQIRN